MAFCRNCGKQIADLAVICVSCGCNPKMGIKFCQNCGAESTPEAQICVKCGVPLAPAIPEGAKSRLTAGLLGIFLGGFGVHRFYLGYTGIGIAQIAVTLFGGTVSCIAMTLPFIPGFPFAGAGFLWGLIEGILILTKAAITADAKGRPLKD